MLRFIIGSRLALGRDLSFLQQLQNMIKKREHALRRLPFDFCAFQMIKSISGSSSMQLDLNFVRQAFVVSAQNFNDFIAPKMIRQRFSF